MKKKNVFLFESNCGNSIPWILCLNLTSEYRFQIEIVYFACKKPYYVPYMYTLYSKVPQSQCREAPPTLTHKLLNQ